MGFGNLGIWEMLLIAVFILVFFGPNRLPEISRSVGKAMREFRRGVNEIQREIEQADRDTRRATRSTAGPTAGGARSGAAGSAGTAGPTGEAHSIEPPGMTTATASPAGTVEAEAVMAPRPAGSEAGASGAAESGAAESGPGEPGDEPGDETGERSQSDLFDAG